MSLFPQRQGKKTLYKPRAATIYVIIITNKCVTILVNIGKSSLAKKLNNDNFCFEYRNKSNTLQSSALF